MKVSKLICLLLSIVVLSGCAAGEMTVSPKSDVAGTSSAPQSVTVTVLGDSIASGYGLENIAEERYSRLLKKKCESDGKISFEYNFAVNGADTSDLLKDLKEGKYTTLDKSDYIIISIGGNNFLGYAMDFFKNNIAAFISMEDNKGAAFDDYNAFIEDVLKGLEQFEKDLPEITKQIHEKTDAVIILQTVYNPYINSELSFYVGGTAHKLSELADSYIAKLNSIITDKAAAYVYAVADIYTAFKKSTEKNVNAEVEKSVIGLGLDPHPNVAGHRLIADTIYPMISK